VLRERDRGTVLLLFPAGFVVMLVLGAIAIDVGLVQVRARELEAVASSAANDSLAALDVVALRDRGVVELDVERVHQIAEEAIAAGPLPDAALVAVDVHRDALARLEVAITLRLVVELVLAPALASFAPVTEDADRPIATWPGLARHSRSLYLGLLIGFVLASSTVGYRLTHQALPFAGNQVLPQANRR
jgi:hypothetical protein